MVLIILCLVMRCYFNHMRHWGLGGVLFYSFYVTFMSNAMTFISSDVYIYDVYVYDVFIYECLCLYLNLHIYIYTFISTLMTFNDVCLYDGYI